MTVCLPGYTDNQGRHPGRGTVRPGFRRRAGLAPSGNSRRQSYCRKAYARMTNTFFERGTDKLEDMIASVRHGYMLFETNNGMEDPKNWQIQCTAEYGIEIVDGKPTGPLCFPRSS